MKPLHPEEVKSAIRMQYGTLLAFEKAFGLPRETTRDVLRGRASAKTAEAIAEVMGVPVSRILELKAKKTSEPKHTSRKRDSHRQNEAA